MHVHACVYMCACVCILKPSFPVLVDIVLVVLILLSATPFPPELKGILFYIQVRTVPQYD